MLSAGFQSTQGKASKLMPLSQPIPDEKLAMAQQLR
jgi:hypothetical protein